MSRARALVMAAALAATGCGGSDVTYTYFVIEAKLDPMTVTSSLLGRIGACAAIAETPSRTDSADLRCQLGFVTHDLGKFEYTTSLTSGAIKFSVIGNDFHQQTLVRGETTLDIRPSNTPITATIVARAIPGVPENPDAPRDAGAPPPPADARSTD